MKSVRLLRKIAVLLVGVPLFIVGIILIPLPGPGILICLGALALFSLEFSWAEKYRDKALASIKKIFADAKAKSDAMAEKANKLKN